MTKKTQTPALDADDMAALASLETLLVSTLTNPSHGMAWLNAIRRAQGLPEHTRHNASELSRPMPAAYASALAAFEADFGADT